MRKEEELEIGKCVELEDDDHYELEKMEGSRAGGRSEAERLKMY